MRESKGVVGLSWEPMLPNLSSATSSGSSSYSKAQSTQPESSVLWKASTELVDGLFVPPNNQRKLNKLLRKQVKDTAGSSWYVLFFIERSCLACFLTTPSSLFVYVIHLLSY